MANESKTPRTDERACDPKEYAHCFIDDKIDIVAACFARKLEQELAEALETSAIRSRIVNKQTLELAEARAEIARLTLLAQNQETVIDAQRRCAKAKNELIEQLRVELKGFVDIMRILTRNSDKTSSNEFTNAMLVCIDRNELIIKDALSAAGRGE